MERNTRSPLCLMLEAVLFASGEPVPVSRLAQACEVSESAVQTALQQLSAWYEKQKSAICVQQLGDSWQMCTHPAYATVIQRAVETKKAAPLSAAAMEVLTIVAYNQPVSKSFVEHVRGVDSSSVVNTLVEKELQFFIDHEVPQVKFVDRTFNCSKEHAMAIWRYLAEHDNGVTNFHFELTAHLIDQEMIDFLSTVRQGLFQFEIGVQSTNPDTIREIRRTTDTERLLAICRQLDKPKNIHLHLDLIAGLPYEDLESFGRSFDTVMQIRPQQMQLGFLKVLKGSLMEQKAPEYGLEYSRRPPFTFIRTRWLDYPQLLQLKEMESVVEDYYNSGLFGNQIEWMLSQEVSPFSFFLDFGAWKVEHQLHLIPQGIAERCTTLWDYYFSRYPERAEQEGLLHDLCLFDLCLHTKPQKLPERVTTQANLPYREAIRALFRNEAQLRCLFGEENFFQHSRQAHLQVFSFDPQTRQPRLCAMLFDYPRRDLLGRAKVTDVSELIL